MRGKLGCRSRCSVAGESHQCWGEARTLAHGHVEAGHQRLALLLQSGQLRLRGVAELRHLGHGGLACVQTQRENNRRPVSAEGSARVALHPRAGTPWLPKIIAGAALQAERGRTGGDLVLVGLGHALQRVHRLLQGLRLGLKLVVAGHQVVVLVGKGGDLHRRRREGRKVSNRLKCVPTGLVPTGRLRGSARRRAAE